MTIAFPSALPTYTCEEYLALEEQATIRSEYYDGEIIPMAGGTTNHNQIAGNFYSIAKSGLRGQGCRVFIGDVRLWIPSTSQYTYPDVMIIEEQPIYQGEGTTTVMNPGLIVEVLSKSTAGYDQSEKFRSYRSLPSFQEYILISQYSQYVEQYNKTANGKWQLTEYTSQDMMLSIATGMLEVPIGELYEDVVWIGS